MRMFKNRLKKLETRRSKRRALALEFDCDAAGAPTDPEMVAWLSTPALSAENAPAAFLERCRGIMNGRVILFPRFAGAAAWESAAAAQQRALIAHARSRTDEPGPAPVASVGSSFEDMEAPRSANSKGRRFIELADGRTFDRETRQYVNEDGKPIAKAGGLSVEWKR